MTERKASLTPEQIAERRRAMDADVWLFIKWVCGHGADDIERFHRPLAYFLAGDALRLAASLNTYESEIVSQLRADFQRRGIDWNTQSGIKKLKAALARVNNRVSRSMGKTTIGLDVLLWLGSVNPDLNIGLTSKSDDAAWAMCETIGNIIRTDAYKLYYGDRLYGSNTDGYITKKWIRLNGRTNPNQDTIEARGVTSQWYSKHYHVIYGDDLASTEAKAGDATVEDAIRFLSSLHGISISDRWGGSRYVFNGTIQGPRDDNAALLNNPSYISTCVPIWKRSAPATLSNLLTDGVPVLPELYDLDACRAKRADTLANDALGAISWLQNFEMTAHNAGSMQFTQDLLRRQKFTWITDPKLKNQDGTPKRYIRRYLWKPDWSPKTSDKPSEDCQCYQACGLKNHAYVQFDPLTLPRMMGVDQAISATGDRWGVGASAIDPHAHIYQLRGEYDKGYWKMPPAIAAVFRRWGGINNPPQSVGMESNTWQGMSADWLKRDESLQFLARRIEKLPPATQAKVMRIMRDIHANLEMGLLWIDPEDFAFEKCALEYNAADPDNQRDDPLDAVAMSIQLHKSAAWDVTDEEAERMARRNERDWIDSHDLATGIDISSNYVEVLW